MEGAREEGREGGKEGKGGSKRGEGGRKEATKIFAIHCSIY